MQIMTDWVTTLIAFHTSAVDLAQHHLQFCEHVKRVLTLLSSLIMLLQIICLQM